MGKETERSSEMAGKRLSLEGSSTGLLRPARSPFPAWPSGTHRRPVFLYSAIVAPCLIGDPLPSQKLSLEPFGGPKLPCDEARIHEGWDADLAVLPCDLAKWCGLCAEGDGGKWFASYRLLEEHKCLVHVCEASA
jgi:hypothetical protein